MTMDSRVNQKLGNGESQGTEMSVADALNQLDLMQQTSASELNTPASPTHSEQADNGSSGGSLLERVTADIQDMVLGVLKLDVQDFSPTTPLMDYGLDSIASTEIGNLFTNKFNIVIPPTVFFEFQDLSSFVQYLMENHQAELQQLYAKTITAKTKTATTKSSTQVSEASQHTKRQITIQAIDMGKKESLDKGNPRPLVPSTPENVQASVIGETSDHYLLNPHTQANLDHVQDTAGSNQLTSIEHLWQESAALLQTPKSEAIKTQIRQPSREYLQSMRRYTDAANVHLVHRVGKRPLEYASYGEGPPMLMLGGLLMHYSVMWLTNIEALAAKHELIMFHMPGCGELTLHDAMSLHSLADDIAAVLDAHGIREPLPVFGCSFGGVMAQAFVTAYPQRCSALAVAVSTPVAEGATDFQSLMRELQVSPHFMELNRGWPMASLPAYEKVIEGFDFCRALNTLDIPSLVVSGGQDKYTTSAHGKMMAESLRHSQFVEFPDAGHLLTFSHYPEFNALLLDFLADAANPPSSAFETGSHYQQSPDISHTDILQTERNLIKNSTLECATEYVRGGQQGHCIMLSDHSAQAAKALRDLTVKNKLAGVDYRSYFVTCAEEALDAAIRIARHYSRNHSRNQSQGQVLIIERGTKWQNYFDPLKQGETEALVPAIVFTSSLENAQAEYALEQFVAVVLVADQEMTVQDLHHFSSRLQSLPALSVLVDAAFSHPASAQSSWLSIEMQCAFDLIVHGEEIADH
ncbi:MAG: alpha/beta fold hydrolase, partial [Pseudomonadota bacterium]